MITKEELLNRGYTKHYISPLIGCDELYQLTIKDRRGIRYHINFKYYDEGRDIFEVQMCFETEGYSNNMTLFGFQNMSIHDIEVEIHRIWKGLMYNYYELYEEGGD